MLLQAQDKALLDILVKKGVVDSQEAAQIAKESVVVMQKSEASKIKLSGLMQTQYAYMAGGMDAPFDTNMAASNGFKIRRAIIGMEASLDYGWRVKIGLDPCRSGSHGSDYVDEAYIAKSVDYSFLNGEIIAGYKKVIFSFEENISAAVLESVEISIVDRYFTGAQRNNSRLGFGGRTTSLQWLGRVENVEGLSYALAVGNSANESLYSTTYIGGNQNKESSAVPNLWANVAYAKSFENVKIKTGLSFGYGAEANVVNTDNYGCILAVNPYIQADLYEDFTVWATYLYSQVDKGKNNASQTAHPQGFTISGEYRFELAQYAKLGFTLKYAALFTDGRGLTMKDVIISGQNAPTSSLDAYYDSAQTVYSGINWYINGNNLKLQFGYEWGEFTDTISGSAYNGAKRSNSHIVRAQLQALF